METQLATGLSNALRRSGSGSSCEDVYMGRAAASEVGDALFTNQSENLTGGLNDLDWHKCAGITERNGEKPRAGSSCKVRGMQRDCVRRCPEAGG